MHRSAPLVVFVRSRSRIAPAVPPVECSQPDSSATRHRTLAPPPSGTSSPERAGPAQILGAADADGSQSAAENRESGCARVWWPPLFRGAPAYVIPTSVPELALALLPTRAVALQQVLEIEFVAATLPRHQALQFEHGVPGCKTTQATGPRTPFMPCRQGHYLQRRPQWSATSALDYLIVRPASVLARRFARLSTSRQIPLRPQPAGRTARIPISASSNPPQKRFRSISRHGEHGHAPDRPPTGAAGAQSIDITLPAMSKRDARSGQDAANRKPCQGRDSVPRPMRDRSRSSTNTGPIR